MGFLHQFGENEFLWLSFILHFMKMCFNVFGFKFYANCWRHGEDKK